MQYMGNMSSVFYINRDFGQVSVQQYDGTYLIQTLTVWEDAPHGSTSCLVTKEQRDYAQSMRLLPVGVGNWGCIEWEEEGSQCYSEGALLSG